MSAGSVQSDEPSPPAPAPPAPSIENLTTEIGWLLITAGVIGVIMPGVPGAPFLLLGGFVVAPGGTKLLSRWMGNDPPKFVKGALKQIGRFVEDIDRRYPPRDKPQAGPSERAAATSEASGRLRLRPASAMNPSSHDPAAIATRSMER